MGINEPFNSNIAAGSLYDPSFISGHKIWGISRGSDGQSGLTETDKT